MGICGKSRRSGAGPDAESPLQLRDVRTCLQAHVPDPSPHAPGDVSPDISTGRLYSPVAGAEGAEPVHDVLHVSGRPQAHRGVSRKQPERRWEAEPLALAAAELELGRLRAQGGEKGGEVCFTALVTVRRDYFSSHFLAIGPGENREERPHHPCRSDYRLSSGC